MDVLATRSNLNETLEIEISNICEKANDGHRIPYSSWNAEGMLLALGSFLLLIDLTRILCSSYPHGLPMVFLQVFVKMLLLQ